MGSPVSLDRITVRVAQPRDDLRVGKIQVDAFVQAYARKMPEVVVDEARKQDLRNIEKRRKFGVVWVAEMDGEVVGTATLFRPGYLGSKAWLPNCAELKFLAVDPQHHGKRISGVILNRCEQLAREWGVQGICLHVRRGAEGVCRLYLSHGYERRVEGDVDLLPEIFLEAFYLSLRAEGSSIRLDP